MKRAIIFFILLVAVTAGAGIQKAAAQCAMCTISAEQGTQNGNTQAVGLNTGVLYLMAIPYLMIAAIGFLWYKRYRRSQASLRS
ncbi:hypothetical protein [Pedobacter sp. UYP1]|jgi:hypothetical protein|uniref:hypothetical protein n=1 Tax=Pedobacter sp. UYP1 TaxID=1756396 RepID=UPI00339145F6